MSESHVGGLPAERLRAATWPTHVRLERALGIAARFSALPSYRLHLARMWGFCAALEDSLVGAGLERALPDAAERGKRGLLERDLAALGCAPAAIAALPRPRLRPRTDVAGALGAAYVLEGATQGGRVLLPLVRERLGLEPAAGAAFLASYGDDVDARWLAFVGAVNAWCATPERLAAAVEGAEETFDALYRWLVDPPARAD